MLTENQKLYDFTSTFLLVADENLQRNSSLHLNWHLVVIDQTEAGQLQSALQVLVTFELHLAKVMQHPAGLCKNTARKIKRK